MKQLRTVLETEHSIDDIFDALLYFFAEATFSEKYKKNAYGKSKKAKEAYGFMCKLFLVTDQNTGTTLLYRAVPLPW